MIVSHEGVSWKAYHAIPVEACTLLNIGSDPAGLSCDRSSRARAADGTCALRTPDLGISSTQQLQNSERTHPVDDVRSSKSSYGAAHTIDQLLPELVTGGHTLLQAPRMMSTECLAVMWEQHLRRRGHMFRHIRDSNRSLSCCPVLYAILPAT